jgi:hypothetical protein
MAKLDTYKNIFPHAKLTRSPDGVLEVMLHTNGETLVFDGHTHEEFVDLFHQIGQDADNRVVILTGAGEAFIDRIEPAGDAKVHPSGAKKGARNLQGSTTSASYCSGARWTIWRPPFISLRLLMYSSGRSQRTGTFNPIKSAMLPINDVQLDISALQTGELACNFLM